MKGECRFFVDEENGCSLKCPDHENFGSANEQVCCSYCERRIQSKCSVNCYQNLSSKSRYITLYNKGVRANGSLL